MFGSFNSVVGNQGATWTIFAVAAPFEPQGENPYRVRAYRLDA